MRPYVLAHSEATILVVFPNAEGLSYVTAWEPAREWHSEADPQGAEQCATVATGKWARVDQMRSSEFGIPPPWAFAWQQIYRLVPELETIGMRTRGMVLVLGDPRKRVCYARERAKRDQQRKRSGRGNAETSDPMRDVGPLGLGGCRAS